MFLQWKDIAVMQEILWVDITMRLFPPKITEARNIVLRAIRAAGGILAVIRQI